jgi:hypothetical protein
VNVAYRTRADTLPRLMGALQPALADKLYAALKNLPPARTTEIRVHALRVSAAPFGNNAPLRVVDFSGNIPQFDEWQISHTFDGHHEPHLAAAAQATHHDERTLFLDNDYDMAPDSLTSSTVGYAADSASIITVAAGALCIARLRPTTERKNGPDQFGRTRVVGPKSNGRRRLFRHHSTWVMPQRAARAGRCAVAGIGEVSTQLTVSTDLEPTVIVVSGERADLLGVARHGVGAQCVRLNCDARPVMQKTRRPQATGRCSPTRRSTLSSALPRHPLIADATRKIYGNVSDARRDEDRRWRTAMRRRPAAISPKQPPRLMSPHHGFRSR